MALCSPEVQVHLKPELNRRMRRWEKPHERAQQNRRLGQMRLEHAFSADFALHRGAEFLNGGTK
jgi:hypothetical protein